MGLVVLRRGEGNMRSRAPGLLLAAPLIACALAPATAFGAPSSVGAQIAPYNVTIENSSDAATLASVGTDMDESGYQADGPQEQTVGAYLTPAQADTLTNHGLS